MNGNQYKAIFTNVGGSTPTTAATLSVFDAASCAGTPSGQESVLSGHWAVLLQGWQGTGPGSPAAAVFSFDASGTGSGAFVDVSGGSGLTGQMDANFGGNGASSVLSDNLLTAGSSYSVGLDPTNNSGYLGCMVLAGQSGTKTVLRFALSVVGGTAVRGSILRWTDTTGNGSEIRASGVLLPQDTSSFSVSALHSNYAFGADGTDSNGGHLAFAGNLAINGSGTVTSSTLDMNDAGNVRSDFSYSSASFTATATIAESGRMLFTDTFASTTNHSAAYVVNANELFFVSIDPFTASAIFSGRDVATNTSFTNASLNGNYVDQIYGITSNDFDCANGSGSVCAEVGLGVLQFSGSGTLNNGSTLFYYQVGTPFEVDNPSGQYAVAASGRVTITGTESLPVIYLATPQSNTEPIAAFTVATDAGAGSIAGFGLLEAGANSSVNIVNLAGNYIFSTTDPGDSTVANQVGVVRIDTSGNISGYQYSSDTTGLTEGPISNGMGGPPAPVTISNSPLPGFGDVGPDTVMVTNGTRFWFIEPGEFGNPASIKVAGR
jgi:hypothetical protein